MLKAEKAPVLAAWYDDAKQKSTRKPASESTSRDRKMLRRAVAGAAVVVPARVGSFSVSGWVVGATRASVEAHTASSVREVSSAAVGHTCVGACAPRSVVRARPADANDSYATDARTQQMRRPSRFLLVPPAADGCFKRVLSRGGDSTASVLGPQAGEHAHRVCDLVTWRRC